MKVRVVDLCKTYQSVQALHKVNLTFSDKSLTAVVGPSGCGKTTLLRALAGFLFTDSGQIYFADQEVTHLPPQTRGTAMVFQNYALWPHMTVFENVAYGLRLKKMNKKDITRRVIEALRQVELDPDKAATHRPAQYSGGQQQRIALARALVVEPRLLLMDEPLSNLDAKVRQRLRVEIRNIQQKFGITAVYVTHDQEEALSIADQVVVMNQGRVEQSGSPQEVYHHPCNYFVAYFLGDSNSLDVFVDQNGLTLLGDPPIPLSLPASFHKVVQQMHGGPGKLVLRAGDAQIIPHMETHELDDISCEEVAFWPVEVLQMQFTGSGYRHFLCLGSQELFIDTVEPFVPGAYYLRVSGDHLRIYFA